MHPRALADCYRGLKLGANTDCQCLMAIETTAGGDANNPQAATLVKMGVAKDASQVKHVFLFSAILDLELWVTPNPSGEFAEANPLVKPSANAATDDM